MASRTSAGLQLQNGTITGPSSFLIRLLFGENGQIVPTASAILDGTIVAMAFQPKQRRTFFAIYSAGHCRIISRSTKTQD
jgi:hypothetical protein